VKSELELKASKRLLFTVGERTALAADKAKQAISLTETTYQRTQDPVLKSRLGLKLARMYMDTAESWVISGEAKYEKQLEQFYQTRQDPKQSPPSPPKHVEARAMEDKAIELLETGIPSASAEDQDDSLYFLGRIYTNRGELQNAVSYFKRIVNHFPNSEFRWEAQLMMAESYFSNGQFQSAYDIYSELIPKRPEAAYPRYKQAWSLLNLERYDQAIAGFLSLHEKAQTPANQDRSLEEIGRQIESDMIVVFAVSGKIEEGIQFFNRLGEPKSSNKIFKMARLLNEEGQYALARKVCEHVFEAFPSSALIPGVILVYVDTFKEWVHDVAKYHHQVSQQLDAKLTQFPPVKLASQGPAAKTWVDELEDFLVKQAKNLHSEGQKRLAASGDPTSQNKRMEQQGKDLLQAAQNYYELYLTHFEPWPEARSYLEMAFYLAELFFQLNQYQKAAEAYVKVIRAQDRNPSAESAKFRREALYGAVVSYDKLLNLKEGKTPKKSTEAKIQPLPFATTESHFVQVATLFLNELPGHASYQQICYRTAKVYYDHNYFKEAIPLFWETIRARPSTQLARYSGDLILDSYHLQEDYGNLRQAGMQLMATPGLGDSTYKAEIQTLMDQAQFKAVESYEKNQDYQAAATAYLALGQSNAVSKEMGELALHNAAVNFIKVNQWKQAVEAYTQLSQQYPKSQYRSQALLTLAEFYQYLGDFKNSQSFFKQFLQSPGSSSPEHINVAYQIAFVADVLGHSEEAVAHYLQYLKLQPKAADRNEVIGKICFHAHRSGAGNHVAEAEKLAATGSAEAKTRCEFETVSQAASAKQTQSVQQGLASLGARIKKHIPVHQREILAPYLNARVESLEQKFQVNRLATTPPDQSSSVLQSKLNTLKRLEGLMDELATYGVVSSIFNGYKVLGTLYVDLADDILAAPTPEGLGEADLAVYRDQIQKVATPLREKGIENIRSLIAKAGELKVLDPTLPSVWKQYYALGSQRTIMIPEWLSTLETMPFYLPTTPGPKYLNSFFPTVHLETFTVAQSVATLPNLSTADSKTRDYYEILTLVGRGDYPQAWTRLMPILVQDLKNPYLLNVLAYLKLASGLEREAVLVVGLATKSLSNKAAATSGLLQVLQINEALVWIGAGELDKGLGLLEASLQHHRLARLVLGFLALRAFNFFWARNLFYGANKNDFQGNDGQWLQLGEAISKWGTLEVDAARSQLEQLNTTDMPRGIQIGLLPLLAALYADEGVPGFSKAKSTLQAYQGLRDTHRERQEWTSEVSKHVHQIPK
jgi:tetratricopeptide (TPR) repeat protein